MLTHLRIKDFALIEELELSLGPGLTVISGETGAGKSIILAAVGLLLGQRAAADLIRKDAEAALVEAQFELAPGGKAARLLAEAGLGDAEGQLIVRRVVSAQGKNQLRINGSLANLSLLAALGPELLLLCGQHAQQGLLRPEDHLLFLDDFAGLAPKRREVAAAVARAREGLAALDKATREQAELLRRREDLAAVVEELSAAELRLGEEEELRAERRLLANLERFRQLGDGAYQGLYAADEGTVLAGLGRVRGLLTELKALDGGLAELAGRVDEAYFLLDDAARELSDRLGRLTGDPARLDWIESRLARLQKLGRKHGGDVAAALSRLAEARGELERLAGSDRELRELGRRAEAELAAAAELGRSLSAARREAAPRLARAVETALGELGMPHGRFQVEFPSPAPPTLATPAGPLAGRGLEQAEFLLAPNPGEGFRPLARIASGGELSRILLALLSLSAARRGTATQVYDEVDAGIGGVVGSAVGRKLAALTGDGQVICITHLPQIAAWADRHLVVRKEVRAGRTLTVLSPPLDPAGRVEELARMLAGEGGLASARQHARELIGAARPDLAA